MPEVSAVDATRTAGTSPRPAGIAPASDVPATWWLASAAVVAVAVVAVFGRCVDHRLVAWDDDVNWRNNPFIRGFEWSHLQGMLTDSRMGVWQPVSWLVAAAQFVRFAPDGEPALSRGIHVVSIVLHVVASLLCLALMRRLLSRAGAGYAWATPVTVWLGATIATLFFAIHPLRVECVAWASGQPYILALIGGLATLVCYLRAADPPADDMRLRTGPYLAALAFYAFGLLSKAITIPLVGVMLVLDVYPLRRVGGDAGWATPRLRALLVEKLPFFTLAGVAAGIAYWATVSTKDYVPTPLLQKLEISAYGVVFHPSITLLPVNLSPQYAEPVPFDTTELRFALAIPLALAVTAVLVLLRRRYPSLLAAWVVMVICLFPNLQLVRHGGQMVADRYTYLSCLGITAILGALAARSITAPSLPRVVRALSATAVAAVLVLLGVHAARYAMVYRDSIAIWTVMTERNPGWPMGPYNLGLAHRRERQDREAARVWYQKALELYPNYPEANVNMGNLVRESGDVAGAVRYYQQALLGRPNFYMAQWALGQIAAMSGQRDVAVQRYRIAIEDARASGEAARIPQIEKDLQRVLALQ